MSGKPDAILIDVKDNVATAIRPLQHGEKASVNTNSGILMVTVTMDIPPNHKFATRDIKAGEHVVKFGEIIGVATANINQGSHVHTHNLRSIHGRK